VIRGGRRVFSVDTNRFMAVCVSGAIFAPVAEVMEDERLWDVESSSWFWPRGGSGTGVRRTARKKRFIAKDMATVCPRRRNAHKCRIFRRLPKINQ
jgi:hypothetical protein